MANIIVGQSGGPTAVINASLAGVFKASKEANIKIYGMVNGIQGLLEEKILELDKCIKNDMDLELLKRTPSSYLGSCRYKLPSIQDEPSVYDKIFCILKKFDIDKFLYIGGNDSMDTIKRLSEYADEKGENIKFIGIPKTIDNDLAITDHTPGYGSACKFIATTLKEILKDATVYERYNVTIVEIMGRNAGWLTGAAALTKSDDCDGVDLIYFPENIFCIDEFLGKIKELLKVKKSIVVAVSEGIHNEKGQYICELYEELCTGLDSFGHKTLSGTATTLANIVGKETNAQTRAIELNIMQRCASHLMSKCDMDESFLAGIYGVNASIKGETGKVVIFNRMHNNPYHMEFNTHSVADIANLEKKVPLEWIDNQKHTITKEFIDYMKPLIQGEVYPFIIDGLPKHIKRPSNFN